MKSNLVALFKNERGQITIEYFVTSSAMGLCVWRSF